MKRGNTKNWSNLKVCTNLLFFAQLANELLFDYSIPSNRIPTLNSHYLCYDAIGAINSIESKGVPQGTLKPIIEELYVSLSKDVLFKLCSEEPLNYFVKYDKGKYRYISNPSELNYEESKIVIQAINKRYFSDDWYINQLKSKIYELVTNNNENDQNDLFSLTKIYFTQLINGGYDTRYIYQQIHKSFFKHKPICCADEIKDFLDNFNFKKNKYTVIIKTNNQCNKLFSFYDDISCLDDYEQKALDDSDKQFRQHTDEEKFVVFNVESLDPYTAVENRKSSLNDNLAFYKMYDHYYHLNIDNLSYAVYDENKNFYVVKKMISSVHRAKALSIKQINNCLDNIAKVQDKVSNYKDLCDFMALINAAKFHSLSLDSISEKNQLLDLWAIFETLLDISNEHTSDRIQQICIYLIPILKKRYIYDLFLQLSQDLKNYSEEMYSKIVDDCECECENVKKVFEFVVSAEKSDIRDEFLSICEDFPLLKERIVYYNKVLSSPYKIYQFVEKHSERVRWQVMRIYRNRNLIIHNGSSTPYLKLLVENLHSYVDSFLDYIVLNLSSGNSLNSMFQELFANECKWVALFGRKKGDINEEIINMLIQQ